jgi:ATP-binding cassette subfamily B protein
MSETSQTISPSLPSALRSRANGELEGQSIVAWAEFDLDLQNQFRQQFIVLTETTCIVLGSEGMQTIPISELREARIVEGLGVDNLNLIVGNKLAVQMRYTRRQRRDMTRMHRKLERIRPRKQGESEIPPDWLDVVERREEEKSHCPKCGEVIPSYAEGVCPRCLHKRKILWRLLDVAKPYRSRVRLAMFLTMVASGIAAFPAFIQKLLVDRAIVPVRWDAALGKMVSVDLPMSTRIEQLFLWASVLTAIILVSEFFAGCRLRVLAMLGTQLTADLRHMTYAHLHELSLRYFAKRRTGSLITRVTNDTDRLWDFVVFGSVDLIRDVVMIVAFASVMFYVSWKLALIALLPLPPLAVLTYKRGMKMQSMFGRLWTYWSRLTAVVGDALPGVRVVKAFANEHREVSRFDRRSDEYAAKEREIHIIWSALAPVVSGLMRLGGVLVWTIGGYMIIRNSDQHITFGTLVMFGAIIWQFYQPIMELANSNRMVTRAATSAQRIFEVLDTPPEIYSRSAAVTKERLEGKVEFRNVSFSYEGAEPALREISLTVEPHQMIGLCGPSGAGKSTFVNLLCRFYDVTDGQILIDGLDIRDYDVRWLRRQVGMVLQEPYLFHGTIADNIRYGAPSASEREIVNAAKAANAHDFVVSFPDGYDTMVGERGQSLSGGERQRISIARAILHNPRLLILDEATSSVDTETEKQIQQALDRLVEGRTTFAIAHRLSTLQAADRLIVLEKGRVAEQGLHADLVDKPDGVYAKLHRTQMEMSSLVAIR